MFKHIKNNKGFSLIELMVVLAIIGILAAIAVPSYTGFQQRARQAEAKQVLGGIYVGQKAYYVEKSTYHSQLDKIGLSFEKLKHYEQIGFKEGTANTVADCNGKCAFVNTADATAFAAGGNLTDCESTATTFLAGAVGAASAVGTGFKINEGKVIDEVGIVVSSNKNTVDCN